MQCTCSGSYGIGITATSIIFYGSNQQSGFTYPSGPSCWLFTYYSPASSCPYYTSSSLSTNCWMSQQLSLNQIPLNNKKLHIINTSTSTSNIYFGMPASPALGIDLYIKDGTGNALTNTIHLQGTGSNDIDGSGNDAVLNISYGNPHYVYSGGGISGHWYSI